MFHYGIDADADDIDHRDRDKSNDRIENLRVGSHQENMFNKELNSNNTSGHRCVYWYKRDRKWLVKVAGKHIGYYTELNDAIEASRTALRDAGGNFYK